MSGNSVTDHDPHGFLEASGVIRACDGSATKRDGGQS